MNPITRTIRVLVADDVPEVLDELAELVGATDGMELVATAATGAEAVDRALHLSPDVVVLDLRMPGLDGITAARRITATLPGAHVVVHSAYHDDSLRQDAEWAGAARYLPKGVTAGELVAAIREAADLPPRA